MIIFVFDTETTWFFDKKEPNLDKQPYIIQFAWILWEYNWKDFKEIKRINQLIKPKISIPFESSKIHNIYDIDVVNSPSIEKCIDVFLDEYLNKADVVIWHNIEFDEEMLKIELKRLNKEYKYNPKNILCTMKNTVDYCKIKWNFDKFKYPKLWELYKKVFDSFFIWAHDAMIDVEATLKIVVKLLNDNVLSLSLNKVEKLSLF